MNSGYWCPRCRTMYGFYVGRDEALRREHNRRLHECAAGRCPGWRRVAWRLLTCQFRRRKRWR